MNTNRDLYDDKYFHYIDVVVDDNTHDGYTNNNNEEEEEEEGDTDDDIDFDVVAITLGYCDLNVEKSKYRKVTMKSRNYRF